MQGWYGKQIQLEMKMKLEASDDGRKMKAHKTLWWRSNENGPAYSVYCKANREVAASVQVEWGSSGDGGTQWLGYCVAGGI